MPDLEFDAIPNPQRGESPETTLQRLAVHIISNDLLSSAANMAAITPDDDNDLAQPSKKIIVGGAGNVAVDTVGGQENVIIPLSAGTWPLRVTRVYSTDTTATGLVALW